MFQTLIGRSRTMKVSEIMTKTVATCDSNSSLSDVTRIMWDHNCGSVPVVDAETGKVLGIVTDRDALIAAWSKGQAPQQVSVKVPMSQGLFTCRPDDDLTRVHQTMRENRVHRILVIDDQEKLLGLVSIDDLARSASGTRATPKDKAEFTTTFAAVARPLERMATA
jgi:CBS domain-containing protein